MSDVMFYGVLRMPYIMAMESDISRLQFYSRVQECADRCEKAESEVARLTQALADKDLALMEQTEIAQSANRQAEELQAELKRSQAACDAQGALTQKYQELALNATQAQASVAAMQANPHASTFPAEIWLNVGDGDAHGVGPYKDLSELSWCWESINQYDVRYVRADLAAPQQHAQAAQADDDLPPLTMTVYGTRTALELERQRRADAAARSAPAPIQSSHRPTRIRCADGLSS